MDAAAAMIARSSSPIRQDQSTNKRLSTISSTGGLRVSQGLPDFETLLASGASLKVTGIGSHRAIETLGETVDEENGSIDDAEDGSPVITIRQRQPIQNSASRISNGSSSEARNLNGRDRAFSDLEREMASSPDHSVDEESSQTSYNAISAEQRSQAASRASQNRSSTSAAGPTAGLTRAASPSEKLGIALGFNGPDSIVSPFANLLRLDSETNHKPSPAFNNKRTSGIPERPGSSASAPNTYSRRHERNMSSGCQTSNISNTAASTSYIDPSFVRSTSPNGPSLPPKANGTAPMQSSLTSSKSSDLPEAVRLQKELDYWKRTEQSMRSSPSSSSAKGLAIDTRASPALKRQSAGGMLPKLPASPTLPSPVKSYQRGISSTTPVLVSGSMPSPDLTQSPIFGSPLFGARPQASPTKGHRDDPSTSSPNLHSRSFSAGSGYSNASSPPVPYKGGKKSASPRERGVEKDRQSSRRTTEPDILSSEQSDRTLSRIPGRDDELGLGLGISPERLARISQPKPSSPPLSAARSPRLSQSNGTSHARSSSFTIDPTKESPSTASVAMFAVPQQPPVPEVYRMTPTKIDTSTRSSSSTAARSRESTARECRVIGEADGYLTNLACTRLGRRSDTCYEVLGGR